MGFAGLSSNGVRAVAIAMCGAALCTPADAQSISDKLNSWFFGAPATDNRPAQAEQAELDCPSVDIRAGASTLAINTPGGEATPMTMRYQVSIGNTARECAALGSVMTMRVGMKGRVLLGPAGGAGQVDIPIRMAVVHEGPSPRVIVSKFHRMQVAVQPGQTAVDFTHVEQDLTFPMPRPAALESYVVYVGFDPSAAPAKPERKQKKK